MVKNVVSSFLDLHRYPKTRIMATIGEANVDSLAEMLDEGATIFRFNAAHIEDGKFKFGDPPIPVENVLKNIRQLSIERRQPISTYLDLAGPKVRVLHVWSLHNRWRLANSGNLNDWNYAKFSELPNHPREKDTVHIYPRDQIPDGIEPQFAEIDPTSKTPIDIIMSQEDVKNALADIRSHSSDETWRLQIDLQNLDGIEAKTQINLKDGTCVLEVREVVFSDPGANEKPQYLNCVITSVWDDFLFLRGQGANPKDYLYPEILTAKKDLPDLNWALDSKFDVISVSFACSPLEAFHVRYLINTWLTDRPSEEPPLVFAKFEASFSVDPIKANYYCRKRQLDSLGSNRRYVQNDREWKSYLKLIELYKANPIEAICEAFDGVMVARGDLALEADKYEVPLYQGEIIRAAGLRGKPVIVATEVLESMKSERPSTRAEIGDIATAVLAGADIIMLSGEVAATTRRRPADVVRELRVAIEKVEEKSLQSDLIRNFGNLREDYQRHRDQYQLYTDPLTIQKLALGNRLCNAGVARKSSVLIVSAFSGEMARHVALFRPAQKILAVTHNSNVARDLILTRGVFPVVMQYPAKYDLEDFNQITREIHAKLNLPASIWLHDQAEAPTFIVPGLLRIASKLDLPKRPAKGSARKRRFGMSSRTLPTTLHDFELPVERKPLDENEIKYVLREDHYKKLWTYLQKNARSKRRDVQWNIYYCDSSKKNAELTDAKLTHAEIRDDSVIYKNHDMVRIRVWNTEGKNTDSGRDDPIHLTLKSKGVTLPDGTVQRPENEYDVTEFLTPFFDAGRSDASIRSFRALDRKVWSELPSRFREEVWSRFRLKDVEQYPEPSAVQLVSCCDSKNYRLTAEVECELTLELDQYNTGKATYYELEVEALTSDSKRRDEYIHLLFAALDIPMVVTNYPPKYVMTLHDYGILETLPSALRQGIETATESLKCSHRESCPACRKL